MGPSETIGRYLGACRTKYICPLNWKFYLRRHGLRASWRERQVRMRQAGKNAHRLMNFRPSEELPDEFIRLDPWEMAYLFWTAARAERGIVEIGRYNGGSTLVLGAANQAVPIWSIDIAPQDDDLFRRQIANIGLDARFELIVGNSQHGTFPQIAPSSYDLLFIDGDHSFAGCLADLENWWPGLAPGGSVVLHDCYHGCEVQDAVRDFFARNEATAVRGANISAWHWLTSEGSLAHFDKPAVPGERRSSGSGTMQHR